MGLEPSAAPWHTLLAGCSPPGAAEDPSAGGTPGRGWYGFGSACLYLPHPLEELGAMRFSGGLGARCQVGDPRHGDDREDQR